MQQLRLIISVRPDLVSRERRKRWALVSTVSCTCGGVISGCALPLHPTIVEAVLRIRDGSGVTVVSDRGNSYDVLDQ